MLNLQTKETHLSPESHSILGIVGTEAGLDLDELLARVHQEDRTRLQTQLDKVMEDRGSFEYEARFFDDAGKTLSIAGSLVVFQDSHGENFQLIGVCWDKAKFEERNLMLGSSAAVLNHFSVGTFSFDVRNNVPLWNAPIYDLLGCIQGKDVPSVETLLERIHPEDRDYVNDGLQDVLTAGQPFHYPLRLKAADDSYERGELFAQARQDGAGRTTHVFGGMKLYRSGQE